ncbi:small ubiquitin-related modifier 3-like [Rhopalosiphum maidis]|uniref:small ubiquitin-related modifier 3-like n=1 Tax=Rhopalosiphum maidis TaxID=43146 RepID=UPI000F0060D2|nr:small ubiquitin-related modifier 3-like [Rhopalosiphum maidis]
MIFHTSKMAENKGDAHEIKITVNVLGIDNNIIQFSIKKHCHLQKLMDAYYIRSGLDEASITFQIDGKRIHGINTLQDAGIKNNDTIEVYQQQFGGGLYLNYY